jgi:hypothetical protein
MVRDFADWNPQRLSRTSRGNWASHLPLERKPNPRPEGHQLG